MDAKDPVCGMIINERGSNFTSSFKGINYYFCSEKCKTEFDEDPEAVLAMKAERENTMEKERRASLGKMIDEVAHEVRNPLTSIGGFARKVYRRLPQDDPNREYMEIIIEGVDRLENIIGQLIRLSTTSAFNPAPENINIIITSALDLFRKELEEKKIDTVLELMEMPPVVELDRNRFMTAIVNLIRNAIEAVDKPHKTIRIITRTGENNMEIEISDNGKGIPEEKVQYIFDPLFTSKIYGPGLGLTFARRIVQDHGGDIFVRSDLGRGTSFTIRLPLKSSQDVGGSLQ